MAGTVPKHALVSIVMFIARTYMCAQGPIMAIVRTTTTAGITPITVITTIAVITDNHYHAQWSGCGNAASFLLYILPVKTCAAPSKNFIFMCFSTNCALIRDTVAPHIRVATRDPAGTGAA